MFRVRRIFDDALPVNKAAIADVQQILGAQFSGIPAEEIAALPARLHNPFAKRFRTILYVAENGRRKVLGCALVMHDPDIRFCYLDYLATATGVTGRGVGAALYENVRDEASGLGASGVFFECLPDDPDRCKNPDVCAANARRLRFYEGYGARPVLNTGYETPVNPENADNLPHIVYDDLDRGSPLRASFLRKVVRAILERKYGYMCSPEYIEQVVHSIRQDPVQIREPRYTKKRHVHKKAAKKKFDPMVMVVNDKHQIHHIRERGYVESPTRIKAIDGDLIHAGLARVEPPEEYPEKHILAVHDPALVEYLRIACAEVPVNKSVYPYVFPVRNISRPPKELSVLAGYFCIDTFTPINRNAFPAAKRAVDCVLTATDAILGGERVAYALVRPPGHHAERRLFGGFCYFNNNAVGAHYFSRFGKVVILDIDYHHGNGQQDIFYMRDDVFTISLHGDPSFAYPYFTGFDDERGAGRGTGFNLNLPLPEKLDGAGYRESLKLALQAVTEFDPDFLVLALGFDPAKGDPTGTWSLSPRDFELNGRLIGDLNLPTLVVQEGGYRTRTLGTNAKHFFQGLLEAMHEK